MLSPQDGTFGAAILNVVVVDVDVVVVFVVVVVVVVVSLLRC